MSKGPEQEKVRPEPASGESADRPAGTPRSQAEASGSAFWSSFAAGLRGKVSPTVLPYLNNPAKVKGVWKNGRLTLWVDGEFTRSMLNKPAILEEMAQAAQAAFGGGKPVVSVVVGVPPADEPEKGSAGADERTETEKPAGKDALDELLAFGEQFDNIVIQ